MCLATTRKTDVSAKGAIGPASYDQGSQGYGGAAGKITESTLATAPILMGARVYLPSLGRFMSRSPVADPEQYPY